MSKSNKVREENKRTHETRKNSIYLNWNLNLGDLAKKSKKRQIKNSETSESSEISKSFSEFSSSEFSILGIRSKSKSQKRKSWKIFFEVSTWPTSTTSFTLTTIKRFFEYDRAHTSRLFLTSFVSHKKINWVYSVACN